MFLIKRKFTILGGVILLLSAAYLLLQDRQETAAPAPSPLVPTVTAFPTIIQKGSGFLDISSIPTLAPGEGLGVDINSPKVKASQAEIQKLYPSLPYSATYALSTGIETSVIIPQEEYQDNPWTLLVGIFGIDYQIPSADEDYALMRDSFIESAERVFSFIRTQGADPNKVYIIWGDQEITQERAASWLNEP